MQQISTKAQSQILEYKLAKITRLVRKIRDTFQDEGLDLRQLPQILRQPLYANQAILPGKSDDLSEPLKVTQAFRQENSSKIASSIMLALSETYQDLLRNLDDGNHFLPVHKVVLEKDTAIKFEQIESSAQQNRAHRSLIKIEQGVKAQNENTFQTGSQAIKKLKNELILRRKQLKALKAQYQSKKTGAPQQQKPTNNQSKKRKRQKKN